jgi:hypothetical protein
MSALASLPPCWRARVFLLPGRRQSRRDRATSPQNASPVRGQLPPLRGGQQDPSSAYRKPSPHEGPRDVLSRTSRLRPFQAARARGVKNPSFRFARPAASRAGGNPFCSPSSLGLPNARSRIPLQADRGEAAYREHSLVRRKRGLTPKKLPTTAIRFGDHALWFACKSH